jgi:hypothetical protein
MTHRTRTRVWLLSGALAVGAVVGGAGIAMAATGSPSTGSSGSGYGYGTGSGTRPDPATVAHGPGETLLTGTTAAKVTAAALAAVPGSTVIRVETDSSGAAAYEAHLRKADGTEVTVLVDKNFAVTKTETGFGPGPKGQAPNGQAPNGRAPNGRAPGGQPPSGQPSPSPTE